MFNSCEVKLPNSRVTTKGWRFDPNLDTGCSFHTGPDGVVLTAKQLGIDNLICKCKGSIEMTPHEACKSLPMDDPDVTPEKSKSYSRNGRVGPCRNLLTPGPK